MHTLNLRRQVYGSGGHWSGPTNKNYGPDRSDGVWFQSGPRVGPDCCISGCTLFETLSTHILHKLQRCSGLYYSIASYFHPQASTYCYNYIINNYVPLIVGLLARKSISLKLDCCVIVCLFVCPDCIKVMGE